MVVGKSHLITPDEPARSPAKVGDFVALASGFEQALYDRSARAIAPQQCVNVPFEKVDLGAGVVRANRLTSLKNAAAVQSKRLPYSPSGKQGDARIREFATTIPTESVAQKHLQRATAREIIPHERFLPS